MTSFRRITRTSTALFAAGALALGVTACDDDNGDNGDVVEEPVQDDAMDDDGLDDDGFDDDAMDDDAMDDDAMDDDLDDDV